MMDVYCALVHHPVLNRLGKIVTTGVTNVDIHDFARAARTYGLRGVFIVTPITAQRALVDRIASHWREGEGGASNPTRAMALELVQTAESLEAAAAQIAAETGQKPMKIATGAKFDSTDPGCLGYGEVRERLIREDGVALLVFGTGWGLAEPALRACEARLPALNAISGRSEYNHLSVRAAGAIIFDRLLGARSETSGVSK